MHIHRHIFTRASFYHHHFSHSTAAVLHHHEPPELPPLTYLPGFPWSDPKYDETILAIPCAMLGMNICVKKQKAERVPGIVFEQDDDKHNGNKCFISIRSNQIRKLINHLSCSFFLSRLFELEVWSEFKSEGIVEKVRVLPRKIHLKAGTDAPLNVTFIRAPSYALLKVDVPLVFKGEDVSPGLNKGAYLNTMKRTVKYLCHADIIPSYIDVDLSELDVGQKLVLGDLNVHPALKLLQPKDVAACKIMGQKVYEQQNKSK